MVQQMETVCTFRNLSPITECLWQHVCVHKQATKTNKFVWISTDMIWRRRIARSPRFWESRHKIDWVRILKQHTSMWTHHRDISNCHLAVSLYPETERESSEMFRQYAQRNPQRDKTSAKDTAMLRSEASGHQRCAEHRWSFCYSRGYYQHAKQQCLGTRKAARYLKQNTSKDFSAVLFRIFL